MWGRGGRINIEHGIQGRSGNWVDGDAFNQNGNGEDLYALFFMWGKRLWICWT